MEEAKTNDPEMYALIEKAFNELVKGTDMGGQQTDPTVQPTEPLSPPVDPSTQQEPDMSQMLG